MYLLNVPAMTSPRFLLLQRHFVGNVRVIQMHLAANRGRLRPIPRPFSEALVQGIYAHVWKVIHYAGLRHNHADAIAGSGPLWRASGPRWAGSSWARGTCSTWTRKRAVRPFRPKTATAIEVIFKFSVMLLYEVKRSSSAVILKARPSSRASLQQSLHSTFSIHPLHPSRPFPASLSLFLPPAYLFAPFVDLFICLDLRAQLESVHKIRQRRVFCA